MALIMGFLGSARKNGYTATLLNEMIAGAESIGGVETEIVHLAQYKFGPCISCFNCIRRPDHVCTLDDDLGREGEGILFKKTRHANAVIIASPVYYAGISALAHLFLERLYPFLWSEELSGIPFAGITCASNVGMHSSAVKDICKFAYNLSLRWIDGLPVHTSFYKNALGKARVAGKRLADAAISDAERGRSKFTDVEAMRYYRTLPYDPLEEMMENLKMIEKSIREKTFKKSEAINLLEKAMSEYREAVQYYRLMNYEEAIRHLCTAAAHWGKATWIEYLLEIIKAPTPGVYERP